MDLAGRRHALFSEAFLDHPVQRAVRIPRSGVLLPGRIRRRTLQLSGGGISGCAVRLRYFRSMFRNPVLPIWRARELAKKLQRRRDWTPELSIEIMRQITLDKFSRTPKLRAALLATCDEQIVAENNWHEQFWGCCTCATRPGKYGRRSSCSVPGRNHLGEVLMSVRDQLGVLALAG